jgi:hypothetical protein
MGAENAYEGFWDNPSKVRDFMHGEYGFLQHKLFRDLNPFNSKKEAEFAEGELAVFLREQGCAVWAGHHDNALLKDGS